MDKLKFAFLYFQNMIYGLVTILFSWLIKTICLTDVIRLTQYGLINGTVEQSATNTSLEYYKFRKIPYAIPPVAKFRFKEPAPPKKWFYIKDATAPGNHCVQLRKHTHRDEVIGNEDCLYLDVYEPITVRFTQDCRQQLLPVMVWFSGESFSFERFLAPSPDFLMSKPIILVKVQYRLNVFGFLTTQDIHAPGNLGLKDQTFALQWVKNNILHFGGNPNSVTIFGHGAGAASVFYHILSPLSAGLFHKAISQSGTSLNSWAYSENPKNMVLKLATGLHIKSNDSKTIIKKLRSTNSKVLIKAAFNTSIVGWYIPYYVEPFGPVIENTGNTAFISESMFELFKEGTYHRVPCIVGFNTEEGSLAYEYIINGRVNMTIYEEHPELLIPASMHLLNGSGCCQNVLEKIKTSYFNGGNFTDKVNWIKYMSQELFVRGIMKTITLIFQNMQVYVYRFGFIGGDSFAYSGGVGPNQEMQFLWAHTSFTPETAQTKLTRERLVTMWTNFAIFGNPTPENDSLLQNVAWRPAFPNMSFLDFGCNLVMSERLNEKDSKFWDALFQSCTNAELVTF